MKINEIQSLSVLMCALIRLLIYTHVEHHLCPPTDSEILHVKVTWIIP